MLTFGRWLEGPDGKVSVSWCDTKEKATMKVVRMARRSGWVPPKWWQFWLPKWPKDCAEEYERQIGENDD